MDKKHLYSAATVAVVIVMIAAFQKHVSQIPVLGVYLPGSKA
jgi:hypothetical protein